MAAQRRGSNERCAICHIPLLMLRAKLWLPEHDREERVHVECKNYFESSRPPADVRRARWLEQKEKET